MPPQAQPEVHKSWVFAHPYVTALCAAVLLVLGGIFFVTQRSSTSTSGPGTQAWGGGIQSLLSPEGYLRTTAEQNIQEIMKNVEGGAPYTYTPPTLSNPSSNQSAPVYSSEMFDYDAIIALLSLSGKGTTTAQASADSQSAWAFIPSGLISTTTVDQSVRRTRAEQALFDYGNEVGSYIQSFEDLNRNMVQILKDQLEDPTDAAKIEAVKKLGRALRYVGTSMEGMEPDFIPKSARSLNTALAGSYKDIGNKLQLVPDAHSTQELLDAIDVYNAAADQFSKNFVSMALLFSISNIKFSSDDPGSVFTFTNASSI